MFGPERALRVPGEESLGKPDLHVTLRVLGNKLRTHSMCVNSSLHTPSMLAILH